MNIAERQQELQKQFVLGQDTALTDSPLEIRFLPFKSQEYLYSISTLPEDQSIPENQQFLYPVFKFRNQEKSDGAIFLMHGLNERSWNKYLCWAEYLCLNTCKPVILFPIAFHINRSPSNWGNPREVIPILENRRKNMGADESQSVANIMLSERLSGNPLRFYTSGKQSLIDLMRLIKEIKQGEHPFLKEDASIDFFSYSIGALLTQIALLCDKNQMLKDSKLFMFCGGSVFSEMNGESRFIMDKSTYHKLQDYYLNSEAWGQEMQQQQDAPIYSFDTMITQENNRQLRENFFSSRKDKIKILALQKDTVIPYNGIVDAIGKDCAMSCSTLTDFPYQYTHEQPFPLRKGANEENAVINRSFNQVFSQAVSFLL